MHLHDFLASVVSAARNARCFGLRSALALVALGAVSTSLAQPVPLANLLPGSTVVAFHLTDLDAPRDFWNGALQTAGYETVAPVLERLAGLAGEGLMDAFRFGPGQGGIHEEAAAALEAECPSLADRLGAFDLGGDWGAAVVGISVSRYNPMPGAVAVLRPADRELWVGVYQDLIYCFASEVSLSQDGVALSVFGDGSDQPLIGAIVDGDVIVATNVDLARASVRLALGANELSHQRTPIGQLASNMMRGGVGMTLDFAALADGLEGLVGMIPAGDGAGPLIEKLLASFKTVSGLAVNATFDAGGLVLSSVVSVDDSHGESELAALVLGSGAPLAPPTLIPRGAASLSVGTMSLPDVIAWVDAWLAAAAPLIGERLDVRSLSARYLELDLDSALLDWLGETWHMAELEVPSTDLVPYLVGMESVVTIPVASESAARAGLEQLTGFLRSALSGTLPLMDEFAALGATPQALDEVALTWDDTVSVKPQRYRGVDYQRWRMGPLSDFGVGVFGGHLVVANPAATMAKVIDVYLGGTAISADASFGPLVLSQSSEQLGYEIIDLPRYLRGFARIADLGAAPLATGLRLLASEAVSSGNLAVSVDELPTFAELVSLGDFVTDLLEALAVRTGVAVGSSETVGEAVWWTFRVPLR